MAEMGALAVLGLASLFVLHFVIGGVPDIEGMTLPDIGTSLGYSAISISTVAAALLALGGLSLVLLISVRRRVVRSCVGVCGVLIALAGFVMVMGYVYGVPLLYGSPVRPVAFPAALCFLFLGAGIWTSAGVDCWPTCELYGNSVGARLTRVFLPITCLVLLVFLLLQGSIVASREFAPWAAALVGFVSVGAMFAFVLRASREIGGDIDRYSTRLEELVEERTQNLVSTRERLDYLIKSIPAVIYSGKPLPDRSDFQLTYLSERVVGMLGFKPEEFLGHPEFWNQHILPEDLKEVYAQMANLWKKGAYASEYRFQHKNGTYRWIREEANLIRDTEGNPAEIDGYWTDVTERKWMEVRLAESKRLVAIGEAAAMVGHDLRNPLQAIFSTIHIAKKKLEKLSEFRGEAGESSGLISLMETIEKESAYMNKIVSDLQDYSNPVRLELKPVEMESAVKEVLSTIRVPSKVRVSVNFSMPTHTHMMDPTIIRRVFTNLIMNAIQAMPNGGELRINASEANGEHLVEFRDTGVGIPKENLNKLFDPFFTTKAKGQGLGLAVCRRLIEAQDGSITVTSMVGEGSTFTVKLPTHKP